MARIKPDPYMVLDRAQCEGALAEMAAIDRKLSAIENEMREAVDGMKNMRILEPSITIKSASGEDQRPALEALADAIIADLKG